MTLEQIQWRGVHVELPKHRDVVLVYGPELVGVDHKKVWFAWYDRGVGWFDIHGSQEHAITHWAELPRGANP